MHKTSIFLTRVALTLLFVLTSTSVIASDYTRHIYTESDWNDLAKDVRDGEFGAFDDVHIILHNDITVSTMMASSNSHYLDGSINGNGHTITVNFGSKDSPVTNPYVGLFRFVRNFEARNLNVAGDIYTNEKYAGGIVANCDKEASFFNCTSSIVIHSGVKGDGTHGDFVAKANVAKFNDCAFYGKLLTTNGTQKCGGFAGWIDNDLLGTDIYIHHCLYAPAPLESGEQEHGMNMARLSIMAFTTLVWRNPKRYCRRN